MLGLEHYKPFKTLEVLQEMSFTMFSITPKQE